MFGDVNEKSVPADLNVRVIGSCDLEGITNLENSGKLTRLPDVPLLMAQSRFLIIFPAEF